MHTLCDIKRQSPADIHYEVSIAIRDSYDFDNDRSMFPFYDNYRKHLARLYVTDKTQFMTTYLKDLAEGPTAGGNASIGPLNKPDVFTCFMYAIEKGGYTSPLLWEVDVPFTAAARV